MVIKVQARKLSNGSSAKLKSGTYLCDTLRQKWVLGRPLAAGGFGDIYLVSRDFRKSNVSSSCVAKVEQMSNGPLFVELNFYLRVGKEENIDKWKNARKLRHLGMPHLIAFGSHKNSTSHHRFIIINRYGADIWSLFLRNDRRFSLKSTLTLGIHIINVLEYIHHYGYIHADIKGANLLLGCGKGGENKVYLIDFGLACLYVDRHGQHKEFTQDLRRAHDGTLEYTSRDAHVGAHSRRGDLEVLGYNMVQWLCGELPWEADLADPDTVAAAKNTYMSNHSLFMNKCFPRGGPPAAIDKLIQYVRRISFTTRPDYDKLRGILREGLQTAGLADDGRLQLEEPLAQLSASRMRGIASNTENWRRAHKTQLNPRSAHHGARKPCALVEMSPRRTRLKSAMRSKEFDWVKVLQGHPERDAKPLVKKKKTQRAPRKVVEDLDESMVKSREDPRENPTPAMLQLLFRCRSTRGSTACSAAAIGTASANVLTPAMEEVIRWRMSRGAGNYQPSKTAMATRGERMRAQSHQTSSVASLSTNSTPRLRARKPVNYSEHALSDLNLFKSLTTLLQVKEPSHKRRHCEAAGRCTRMRTRAQSGNAALDSHWRPPTPPQSPRKRCRDATTAKLASPPHSPRPSGCHSKAFPFKRICRREVSPTDVVFVPRLRSKRGVGSPLPRRSSRYNLRRTSYL